VPAIFNKNSKSKQTGLARGLGKGIGAILGSDKVDEIFDGKSGDGKNSIKEIPLAEISVNPLQPREYFNEESIKGLADSIKSMGVINPITVRREGDRFFLIAGERRFRASQLAGRETIPAIVRDATELENLSLALIENIQRENLNPLEEAKAYKLLINKFKLKQHELAEQVGKDRATIANTMRLLNLPPEVTDALVREEITSGHARALLGLEDLALQIALVKEIIKEGLSVRQLEKLVKVKADAKEPLKNKESKSKLKDAQIKLIEGELREKLGTKVEIQYKGNKGKLEIFFYSLDDFDRIRELLNSV
jgi:ParB family chromosome partitioning protein